jgi:KipI family sensor histidine kinase inhibitor
MRVLLYGDRALLVEVDGPPVGLRDALLTLGAPGIEDVIPAARTVLVRFDPKQTDALTVQALIERAAAMPLRTAATAPPPLVTLPVRYDGPDLAAVAYAADCSIEEVINRHRAGRYTVAFCGFAPGFAYLTGLDPRLQLPRRASPRASVPRGSVAIAGEFTAAYPRPSPGGWQLLARTDALLWDVTRAEPALLAPGTPVRFEAVL